jgi:hypothetical protein
MPTTSTLVAIVNYRTGALVIDCLSSLEPEVESVVAAFGPVQVVIVDNASGDSSPALIENAIATRGWGSWAEVRRLDRNGGFAWGNNAAVGPALSSADPPDCIWLLNPDTVVRPGALGNLLHFINGHPRAGIAGSRLEDHDGTVQRSVFRFPSLASEIDSGVRLGVITRLLAGRMIAPEPPPAQTQADWLSGASLLVRREVFDAIGLMDDGYFMYYEETDFCRRARAAGWEVWYVPQSRVVHLVGQASGLNARRQNARRAAYWFESRRRYFLKHLGKLRTLLADALFMAGFASWRLRRRMQGKPDPDPVRFLSDFARASVWRRGFRIDSRSHD